jgi:hypothetical protein
MKISKLNKVDLRDLWKHEALDFTKWLSEPGNLELLSDEIGIGIELVQTEASVGRYNVDILAQEENTGRKIIIENQLETTDHSHLGQLITYAAGIEAEYIVWLVRQARDEHLQAVDWLNEHTDDKLNFFIVVVELWQIDDSAPAVKFDVVSRPNDWKKSVRGSASDGEQTETKARQLDFWQRLRDFAANKYPELKLRKPAASHWYDVAIGRSDCHATLTVLSRENKVGCELYIRGSKELFRDLLKSKDAIEKELGLVGNINWVELPERKASRIRTYTQFDFDNEVTWDDAFRWLAETCIKFKKVFTKDWNTSSQAAGCTEPRDSAAATDRAVNAQ